MFRPAMRPIIIFAHSTTMAAALIPASLSAQQIDSGVGDGISQTSLDPLRRCTEMADDSARHACFDRVIPQLLNDAETGSLTVIGADELNQTRRRLFGFSLPNVPIFNGENGQPLDLLQSTITSVRYIGHDEWHFRIAEGDALWRVKNSSPRMRAPQVGDSVEFKSATLGTYFIRINGRKGVKGNRIR